jgi:hypothetical protein
MQPDHGVAQLGGEGHSMHNGIVHSSSTKTPGTGSVARWSIPAIPQRNNSADVRNLGHQREPPYFDVSA